MTLKIVNGNRKPGLWQSDESAYDEETREFLNESFAELAKAFPAFEKMIWKKPQKGRLQIVK